MIRRFIEHTREAARFAPVRPAVKVGLRAAIATIIPALLSSALQIPGGLWLSVGGFNASFTDKGGSYRSRAASMGAVALTGALSACLGGLAGRHPAFAIPAALLWVTAFSFAGVYGSAANIVGNTAASTFVISLGLPVSSLPEALERGGFVALGALWAMVLSLVLWPIRPYRPARLAIGRCYRAVAELAEAMERLVTGADGAAWQAMIQGNHGRVREALEEARGILAAMRRGRQGESGRGERLLVLLQIADTMFGTLIALGDVVESLSREEALRPIQEEVERTLAAFIRALQELTRLAGTEGRSRRMPVLDWGAEPLRDAISRAETAGTLGPIERAKCLHAARLIGQLRGYMGLAVETAASLPTDRPSPHMRLLPGSPLVAPRRPLLEPLKENLTLGSVVLRHALRVGFTTTVAVALTTVYQLSHGYWVMITVLTIMQPYTGATFLKALQRVMGTVVGGILAAAVASRLHDPHAITLLVFFTAWTCVAVISLNYALYTVFLTLTFVLLAEVGTGDWTLARVRVVNTLIGGALALAGMWLLWERSERELFPEQLAAALRADREFFRRVVANLVDNKAGLDSSAEDARRKMGLSAINAEASFQRLLAEPRKRVEPIEPLMTLLAYTRRFAASVIALGTTEHGRLTEAGRAKLERFEREAGQVMDDVADAVVRGRAPEPLPDFAWLAEGTPEEPLMRAQMERVVRQLTVLYGAASRRGRAPTPHG